MSNILSHDEEEGPFRPIGNRRLFQQVADRIRVAIFKGDLRPGSRLPPEPALAAMLQVSRSALREAVKVLESRGFLTMRRGYGGGTFVRERDTGSLVSAYADLLRLSMVDVEELTRARVFLESVALREAAAHATAQDLDTLGEKIAEARACYAEGRVEARISANLAFHSLLSRFSGNIVLEMTITSILSILFDYLKVMTITPEMIEGTLKSHEGILSGLREGRTEETIALNQGHIQEVSTRLVAAAREKPPLQEGWR